MAYQTGYSKYSKTSADDDRLSLLKQKIKDGKLSGVYLFHGKEEYLKRYYFEMLTKGAGDTDVNVTVIDGADFSYADFTDAFYTVAAIDYSDSFFADEPSADDGKRTIRVIKLYDPKLTKMSDKEKTLFLELLSGEMTDTAVVFYYPYYDDDEEKKLTKGILSDICKIALTVDFQRERPTSPSLHKWVKKHFAASKVNIDDDCVSYIIQSVGCDMSTLNFEIEKLCAYSLSREPRVIYRNDVDTVCIKNAEARIDDISKAILAKDYEGALVALSILRAERVNEVYIFGAIANRFSQLMTVDHYYKTEGKSQQEIMQITGLRDFVVRNNITTLTSIYRSFDGKGSPCDEYAHILSEYDEKLKSYIPDKFALLQNMIFKMTRV